jgi:hypothetical protein
LVTRNLLSLVKNASLPVAHKNFIPGCEAGRVCGHEPRHGDSASTDSAPNASVGVDHVNFLLNALETVPQEQVLNPLRLFAKEVMPHFEKKGDKAEAAAAAAGAR